MHFSVPEAQEKYTNGSNVYVGFNVFINGAFHGNFRFSQLYNLHEDLRKTFRNLSLPKFPPKKLLSLSKSEIEQRRIAIERYLQLIGQDPIVSKSDLLNTFLLKSQQKSSNMAIQEKSASIFLLNGCQIVVNVNTSDCSSIVLAKALSAIKLPEELHNYFALFLMDEKANGCMELRQLKDYESPIISLQSAHQSKIVIRKNYWDPNYDYFVMKDKVGLNLIYLQSANDVEKGWIISSQVRNVLNSLSNADNQIEYMSIVRNLPSYGCLQFSNVTCDFPEPDTLATIIIGNQELVIRTLSGKHVKDTKFKVTRMRCWRVSTVIDDSESENKATRYELSFEYLIARMDLKWIKIYADKKAVLISVCLQSMVDELLHKKNGIDTTVTSENQNEKDYKPSKNLPRASGKQSICIKNEKKPLESPNESAKGSSKTELSSVLQFASKNSFHNNAFENIGDDEL